MINRKGSFLKINIALCLCTLEYTTTIFGFVVFVCCTSCIYTDSLYLQFDCIISNNIHCTLNLIIKKELVCEELLVGFIHH